MTMERSTLSASRSPSPAESDSSLEGPSPPKSKQLRRVLAPQHGPPDLPPNPPTAVTCEWNNCGQKFAAVQGLVEHLHNGHIGMHKSSYTCEWSSCPRRGLVQTSRFALVSHCRSHTGEKPFICPLPECDKSFTRSDTLAKHMRQQHNISTPSANRGGYRKRKRSVSPPHGSQPSGRPPLAPERRSASPPTDTHAPSHYNFANRTYAHHHDGRESGFNTFRVNPTVYDRSAHATSSTMKTRPDVVERPGYVSNDRREEEGRTSSSGDEGSYNPEAMGGRSKAMVKYLIMKAKYRYVIAESGLLHDELEALKRQEKTEWQEKEAGVDRVLRIFGPESEQLIHEPEASANGKRSRHPVSPQDDPRMEGFHPHPPSHISRHDHRMEIDAR